jgi:hypothetical protein
MNKGKIGLDVCRVAESDSGAGLLSLTRVLVRGRDYQAIHFASSPRHGESGVWSLA